MKKNNWEETEIENLLREMPSLKDSRSREEIYQAVSGDKAAKRPKSWGYPALAGIAAVLILALITPSLFNSMNNTEFENSASDMAVEESADTGIAEKEIASLPERTEENSNAGGAESNHESIMMMEAETADLTNVYEEDLLQYDVFTYGLVTADAFAVPVSVLVEKSETGNWLERFEEVSSGIPEEDWGFDNYYPLEGSLRIDKETNELTYTVTDEEQGKLSGGGEKLFYDSIVMVLESSPYEKVKLRNADGSVPSFSHMGEVSEIIKTVHSNKGYYKYTSGNGDSYLVPGEEKFESVNDALSKMKTSPNGFLESVIANDVQFETTIENNLLTLSFNKELTLKDNPDSLLLIEGILMTAKEFGFEAVLFENVESTDWKGFDFSQPVTVPVSPNKKILN
ncbi:hypothetical protein ACOJQI_15160 [Bacillus salacetis]|uniref:hypothetical protein n=1 Tax=Bacillus salacetis TaxID=2315464 RepID=UPI003BA1DF4D